MEQDKPCKTPLEDLKRGALQHYEELAVKCSNWNTSVPHAIASYYDKMIEEENTPKSINPINMTKLTVLEKHKTFSEALTALKEGKWIKVPEWQGYWFLKGGEVIVKTWDGMELNTPWYHNNVLREDWQVVEQDISDLMESFRNQPMQFIKVPDSPKENK